MMAKKAYVAQKIFQNINVRNEKGKLISVNLANPEEGLLGWIPVFSNKKQLQKSLGKDIKFSDLKVPQV